MEDNFWEKAKSEHPMGSFLKGTVVDAKPFGVFVDVGYGNKVASVPVGIIEIVGSGPLPIDRSKWPAIGEEVYCRVISFRERSLEFDLSLESRNDVDQHLK